ncbi:MAG: SDR family oxidoreductase [Alphaproteobacteria bacterium]|jgi:citronellol/citronellal dehydrogenase|nr:short-chain dehydrogenase [Rhodospirillaceae bacterium]MDP6020344.1 SDR family oxidoreductase [Alphaproteobacteria bacterium]MDP6256299.1 SDR family oxidoreductase [Alphaproteobacteria bacterium]MDP7052870.1 SDR family oxidoreductase [Alphaproteobacteria bacterium]MDP7228448.1 SDR family oxidoreductase [Alphaproteobacteria bacterium]|tara:strand:- start:187 stop:1056 length:870 start_codon:yes stop_codon:yes gene_type:complete
MSKSAENEIYAAPTAAELAVLPTVYRDDLFKDQVVLVSGGTGGIGMATAVLFGRLGATIISCGRDEAKMAVFEEDMASLNIPCFTQSLTIRDADLVGGLMDSVWERFGRLDVLINNAGGQFAAPAMDISPNGWRTVVDTNLTGSWLMMQAAARHWRDKKQSGCIINMVTVLAMCTSGIAHTQAARAGEIHLTRGLCVEWAPYDIRLNSIAIGVVASPGLVHYPKSAKPSFDHNPMRKIGTAQDIAQAAVYLAGPSGEFINGTVLTVDGGADVWGEYWPLGRPEHFRIDY